MDSGGRTRQARRIPEENYKKPFHLGCSQFFIHYLKMPHLTTFVNIFSSINDNKLMYTVSSAGLAVCEGTT